MQGRAWEDSWRREDSWRMEGLTVLPAAGEPAFRGGIETVAGAIADLGPTLPPPPPGMRILDGRGLIAFPGFVQAHIHLCQTLFQGLAEGRRLDRWLCERIWPLEAAHDAESMRASARLGITRAALHGATALLDMGTVSHTTVIAEEVEASGIRAIVGKALMDDGVDTPAPLRQDPAEALRDALALHDRWQGRGGGRLGVALAPRFTLSVSAGLWREIAAEARRRSLLVHTHVSETPWENETCRSLHGTSPIRALENWGVLEARAALVHAIWIDEEERAILARRRTALVHCPGSNAKLGSGIAQVPEWLASGIPVALGSDGSACNDDLSLPAEMRLAAQMQALAAGPGILAPREIFGMATRGGAQAMGLENGIGSLAPGRRADLVLYREEDLAWPSDLSFEQKLVHASAGIRPRAVYVDGKPIVLDGRLVAWDEEEIVREAEIQRLRLLARMQGRDCV
ncbi:MAG: amidohydrolase family protein [Candidatus Eisenbacteria bacterium]|nr:amidohydrolase family protein [Candidatus Eisenbacteria bacterium]